MSTAHRTTDIAHDISLVCFDVGGVLVRIYYTWQQVCAKFGWAVPAGVESEWGAAALHDLGVAFETGRIDERTFLEQAAKVTELSAEQVAEAMDAWLIEPYPGVAELIDAIAGAGLATACLSNTNATHWAMMNGDGHAGVPLGRLTHRVASHLVGVMKPDEGIYAHLERSAGHEPGRILFFDDKAENVEAARRRGWRAQVIDPGGDTAGQMRAHLRDVGVELG